MANLRTLAALVAAAILVAPPAVADATPRPELARESGTYDRFIVRMQDGAENAPAATNLRMKKVKSTGEGAMVVSTDRKVSVEEAQQSLQGKVDYIEPDVRNVAFAGAEQHAPFGEKGPNDPRYQDEWWLHGPNSAHFDAAWAGSTGKRQVVAVVDSGITKHPDLDWNVTDGYDMIADSAQARDGDGRDPDPADEGDWNYARECGSTQGLDSVWHGTHVAGEIAAETNNHLGLAGAAPDAVVQPVRVLGKCGGWVSDIADGIIWAAGGHVKGVPNNPNPAKVINLSLGGYAEHCFKTYQRAIDIATKRGALVVAAAGNGNEDARRTQPANCNNVLTVGASGSTGDRAGYSNFGPRVDITAPGGDMENGKGITSTLNSGSTIPADAKYAEYDGTSMATPLVAAAAALVRAHDPTLSPEALRDVLVSTARELPGKCGKGCGSGLLDAEAAMRRVWALPGKEPDSGTTRSPTPTTSADAEKPGEESQDHQPEPVESTVTGESSEQPTNETAEPTQESDTNAGPAAS